MNGPSSSRTATSEEARKFFTSKTITWISVAGVSVVIALLLCLLLSRCCRAKKKDENSKKHYIDAHEDSSVRPKYGESALQQSNQMETGDFTFMQSFCSNMVKFFFSSIKFYLKNVF